MGTLDMAIIRINATRYGLAPHVERPSTPAGRSLTGRIFPRPDNVENAPNIPPETAQTNALDKALAPLGQTKPTAAAPTAQDKQDTPVPAKTAAPVVIMIHGYKFSPGDPRHCPHDHILSQHINHPCWKATSWPVKLGLAEPQAQYPNTVKALDQELNHAPGQTAGLAPGAVSATALAFGWHARGTIWQAYNRAEIAGRQLADLILKIRAIAPNRPIHALAHSLGARVVLAAIHHLPALALDKVILLAGAEYGSHLRSALSTQAGQSCDVINVTSRENHAYDILLERAIAPPFAKDRVLGRAKIAAPNLVTLSLDDYALLDNLATKGYRIARPQHRHCHWSTYQRPGIFKLYAALLTSPAPITLAELNQMIPDKPSPSRAVSRDLGPQHIPSPLTIRIPSLRIPYRVARNNSA